jgi:Rap1a immunity proteins
MTKFVVVILLALTMPASAEDRPDYRVSANYFLPRCKGQLKATGIIDETWDQAKCYGFIEGLVYAAIDRSFCPPKGVVFGQGAAVVIKYIEARPERMHEKFGDLALEALTAAWPCKR